MTPARPGEWLLPLLTGDDPHRRRCRDELLRGDADCVVTTLEARAAHETMRLRLAAASDDAVRSGGSPPPDLTALRAAIGSLDYVMVFGRDHDCQVLLTPADDGPGAVLFCWASPTDRPHPPVTGS
jgi:hypothetical protein